MYINIGKGLFESGLEDSRCANAGRTDNNSGNRLKLLQFFLKCRTEVHRKKRNLRIRNIFHTDLRTENIKTGFARCLHNFGVLLPDGVDLCVFNLNSHGEPADGRCHVVAQVFQQAVTVMQDNTDFLFHLFNQIGRKLTEIDAVNISSGLPSGRPDSGG